MQNFDAEPAFVFSLATQIFAHCSLIQAILVEMKKFGDIFGVHFEMSSSAKVSQPLLGREIKLQNSSFQLFLQFLFLVENTNSTRRICTDIVAIAVVSFPASIEARGTDTDTAAARTGHERTSHVSAIYFHRHGRPLGRVLRGLALSLPQMSRAQQRPQDDDQAFQTLDAQTVLLAQHALVAGSHRHEVDGTAACAVRLRYAWILKQNKTKQK